MATEHLNYPEEKKAANFRSKGEEGNFAETIKTFSASFESSRAEKKNENSSQ